MGWVMTRWTLAADAMAAAAAAAAAGGSHALPSPPSDRANG